MATTRPPQATPQTTQSTAGSTLTRRRLLAGALAATALGAAGCSRSGSGGTPRPAPSGPGDLGVELVGTRRTRAAGDPHALPQAVSAVQDFGAEIFRSLATGGGAGAGANLVTSPLSIHLALAMTALGARGGTASEMLAVLHGHDAGSLALGLNALTAELGHRARTIPLAGGGTATVDLAIADALWGQHDVPWAPAFLDALTSQFGAPMRGVDFVTRPEQARRAVNGWVSGITRGTVPQLVQPGVITRSTRLALVNALYLKAPWAVPFQAEVTRPADFTRADGSHVQVPTMHQQGAFGYGTGPGWRAVRLPYAGGDLAMTAVLPDAMDTFLAHLDGATLRAVVKASAERAGVDLALPRWKARSTLPLVDTLGGLGIHRAFSDDADFGPMTTTGERLKVGAVVHEGYVSVDEAGTVASAATAVMAEAAGMVAPTPVAFDRPFLFVLHDVTTATPLFVGTVGDPAAG